MVLSKSWRKQTQNILHGFGGQLSSLFLYLQPFGLKLKTVMFFLNVGFSLKWAVEMPPTKNTENYIPPERQNNFKENSNFTFFTFKLSSQSFFIWKNLLGEKNITKNEKKALMALNNGPMKKLNQTNPKYFSWFWGGQLSSLFLYLPLFGLKWVNAYAWEWY